MGSRFASLFRRQRLANVEDLAVFVRAEAARVAQVSLFSYLKARMGTQWPAHFESVDFAPALKQAQAESFRICLEDLALYVSAEVGCTLAAPALCAMVANDWQDGIGALRERVERLEPDVAAETVFEKSAKTLIEAAPVAAEFRHEDAEAVANAVLLRWAEVRRKFAARADRAALRLALERLQAGVRD